MRMTSLFSSTLKVTHNPMRLRMDLVSSLPYDPPAWHSHLLKRRENDTTVKGYQSHCEQKCNLVLTNGTKVYIINTTVHESSFDMISIARRNKCVNRYLGTNEVFFERDKGTNGEIHRLTFKSNTWIEMMLRN